MKPNHTGFLRFAASANLQRLIGRELVPSEEFALVELVKNSYDSGATRVTIRIQPNIATRPGFIEISDNGAGMTIEEIERRFMMAGYSERPGEIRRGSRVPTGEKGIGRFAADKLGSELELTTKQKGSREATRLRIDWTAFADKQKRFNEIEAPYDTARLPGWPQPRGGTTVLITRLRAPWKRPLLDRARRTLQTLLDPFSTPSGFAVVFEAIGSDVLTGPVVPAKPRGADIEFRFSVKKDGTVTRELRVANQRAAPSNHGALESGQLAAAPSLAGLEGRLLYWLERPARDATLGNLPGVHLFRDGFRVEPFGSPLADWLGVAEHRAKRAGHAHIVPGRLFGFVEISRIRHKGLLDTTSRQALLGTDDATALVATLRSELVHLEDEIRTRVTEPRWEASQKRSAVEIEQARLQTLASMSYGLAHELRQPLQAISTDATFIGTRLNTLHVRDAEIDDAVAGIASGIARIEKTIQLIGRLSTGDVLAVERFDLPDAIEEITGSLRAQAQAAGVILTVIAPPKQAVVFGRQATQHIVLNLVVNAIRAIKDGAVSKGKVLITISHDGAKHTVDVEDNGPGVPIDLVAKLFEGFTTRTTGGMGVGLHLSRRMAAALGGDLLYISPSGAQGARFRLSFKDSETG